MSGRECPINTHYCINVFGEMYLTLSFNHLSLAKGCENTFFQSVGSKEQEASTKVAVSGGRRGGGQEGEREREGGGKGGGGRSRLWREWWHHQHRRRRFLVFGPWWLALNTSYHLVLAAALGGSRACVLAAHFLPDMVCPDSFLRGTHLAGPKMRVWGFRGLVAREWCSRPGPPWREHQ